MKGNNIFVSAISLNFYINFIYYFYYKLMINYI